MTGTRWWRKVCPRSENEGNIQQFSKPNNLYPRVHQVTSIYFDMVRNYQNYSAGISRYTSDFYLTCLTLTLYFKHAIGSI